jgi:polyisoprenoid-binding protein YceI
MRRFFALAAVLALSACGDAPPPADKAPAEKAPAAAEKAPAPAEKKEVCTYSVAPEGSTVSWTAFKFTEKAGVGGAFDTVSVTPGKGGDEAWKAIDGVAFSIDTASVNTKNPDRDAKIKASFFGTMAETAAIKGTVKANSAGKATLSITMNGATHTTVVDVGNADGGLSLKGTIDVEQWGGGDAIAALNKVCEDLHKGKDGVSKLWSEVDIAATVPVSKSCQ